MIVDTACAICGRTTDARIAEVVIVNPDPRRFAHKSCWLRTFDAELRRQAAAKKETQS